MYLLCATQSTKRTFQNQYIETSCFYLNTCPALLIAVAFLPPESTWNANLVSPPGQCRHWGSGTQEEYSGNKRTEDNDYTLIYGWLSSCCGKGLSPDSTDCLLTLTYRYRMDWFHSLLLTSTLYGFKWQWQWAGAPLTANTSKWGLGPQPKQQLQCQIKQGT